MISDTVIVAGIASIAPTLAVLLTWWQQRRAIKDVRDDVKTHIQALKSEVKRLNDGGVYTPIVTTRDRASKARVTMVDGQATVNRRRGDDQ